MIIAPDRWTRHILHGLRNHPHAVEPHPLVVPASGGSEYHIRYQTRCDVHGCHRDATWDAHTEKVYPVGSRVVFAVHCPDHPQETAP